ncbi:MAG: hypothetical protein CL424_06855 [Acidimicrobiaceae bacterium]|nr:hypothetical protein [Acidimicrobiaceae bacterium]
MTQADVENYLWDVQSRLRSNKHRRGRIVEELRNHIEDGIVEYSSAGMPESEAAALVIEQLGPADQVAASFDTADDQVSAGSARTSWLPVVIPVGWTAITVALLVNSSGRRSPAASPSRSHTRAPSGRQLTAAG